MFKKEDLKYQQHYHWTESNPFNEEAFQSTMKFCIYNGWHTLQLINIFAEMHDLEQVSSCHKIEDIICIKNLKNKSFEQMMELLEAEMKQLLSTLMMSRK